MPQWYEGRGALIQRTPEKRPAEMVQSCKSSTLRRLITEKNCRVTWGRSGAAEGWWIGVARAWEPRPDGTPETTLPTDGACPVEGGLGVTASKESYKCHDILLFVFHSCSFSLIAKSIALTSFQFPPFTFFFSFSIHSYHLSPFESKSLPYIYIYIYALLRW